jgi:Ca-activated chloride channel family protein
MPEQFHFLQPLWLLMLLPLAVLLWLARRGSLQGNPWRRILDPELQPLLLERHAGHGAQLPLWLLALGWLLAVLALANPTWERQPHPLLQAGGSRVIVLDLSRSMLAADQRPTRLLRARFKVEDLLALEDGGQTGLVVFAGDAFTVSPLTRDAETIRAQLQVLEPAIMPVQGSRADLGLAQARELLEQAGVAEGQVILIADGAEGTAAVEAARGLREAGHRVSVLGIGTTEGAPLPGGRAGQPQMVRLDTEALAAIAAAGGGRYVPLSADSRDIRHLVAGAGHADELAETEELQSLKWKEQGPLLAALLLPLAALAFRRGWLLGVLLGVGLAVPPQPVMALSWDDAWQRRDQLAARALEQGDYATAGQLASDPLRRGAAAYRQGDYVQALEAFRAADGADAAYNQGNALARLGQYQDAIAAYDTALEAQPDMEDALFNKAAVETLLRSREQDTGDEPREEEPSSDGDSATSEASQEQSDAEADDASSQGDDAETAEEQQAGQSEQSADEGEAPDSSSAAEDDAGEPQEDAGGQSGQQAEQEAGDQPDSSDSAGESAGDTAEGGEQQREEGETAGAQGPSADDSARASDPTAAGQAEGPDVDAPDEQGRPSDKEAPSGTESADATDGEDSAENGREAAREAGSDAEGSEPVEQGDESIQDRRQADAASQDDDAKESQAAGSDRRPEEQGNGDESRDPDQADADSEVASEEPPREQTLGRAPDPSARQDQVRGRSTPLSTEEQLAAQQVLRRIPDDPGGLLRRKFLFQYRQRGPRPGSGGTQDW